MANAMRGTFRMMKKGSPIEEDRVFKCLSFQNVPGTTYCILIEEPKTGLMEVLDKEDKPVSFMYGQAPIQWIINLDGWEVQFVSDEHLEREHEHIHEIMEKLEYHYSVPKIFEDSKPTLVPPVPHDTNTESS